MTVHHRRFRRWCWLLLLPPTVTVLVLAARLPTELPATVPWPGVLPAEYA